MGAQNFTMIGLVIGFVLDQLFGDPVKLPHPIVGFGKLISLGEKRMNKGRGLLLKGAVLTFVLVSAVFVITKLIYSGIALYNPILIVLFTAILVFNCLSARTLRKEVKAVFDGLEQSVESGRKQLSRIVGRDTATLDAQQIRKAALETLAENLSDGVIAPLFWFVMLGLPGMLAYKMINTLDSMIGYKNDRYLLFGRAAARLDDVANYLPARITAMIMLLVSNRLSEIDFVFANGKKHASPNSGYPEAALAGILDCRFGGPNSYFGKIVEKPYIGSTDRELAYSDVKKALLINQKSEILMLFIVLIPYITNI